MQKNCSLLLIFSASSQVDGYPTLILYKDGRRVGEYEGDRSLESLYDFVVKHGDADGVVLPDKDEL